MIPPDINTYYKLHSKFYDLTRWAFLFGRNSLKNYFPELPINPAILDLGCGTGKQLLALRKIYPSAKIIGIDQSKEMLKFVNREAVESVKLKNEKYSENSFEDNSFDLIVASYSLSMVENINETIQNINTHLKPSGKLLVIDFDSSPFSLFREWMNKNHVQMKPSLFELLKNQFSIEFKKTRRAYFGLFTYSVFLNTSSTFKDIKKQ